MAIGFVVLLSLVTEAISSLFVRGSLSILDDRTVSVDLRANELRHSVDELIGKLHATRRIRLTVDLDGKIVTIQHAMLETDEERYQVPPLATASIGTAALGTSNDERGDSTSAKIAGTVSREVFCKTLSNNGVLGGRISRKCYANVMSIDEERKEDPRENNNTRLRYDATGGGDRFESKGHFGIFNRSQLITGVDAKDESFRTVGNDPADREFNIDDSASIISYFVNRESSSLATPKEESSHAGEAAPVASAAQANSKRTNFEKQPDNGTAPRREAARPSHPGRRLASPKNTSVFTSDNDRNVVSTSINVEQVSARASSHGDATTRNGLRIVSRRSFKIFAPWGTGQKAENRSQVSSGGDATAASRTSAMDEILEAVRQVLPAKESRVAAGTS